MDLPCGFEELGLLTTEEVATMLAMLCDWRVGVQVQHEWPDSAKHGGSLRHPRRRADRLGDERKVMAI